MSEVRAVPTLDELAATPSRAMELPSEVLKVLMGRCLIVQGALHAGLVANGNGHQGEHADKFDRFLNAKGVGLLVGRSASWVNHNKDALPSRRRVGESDAWSERDILRWMQTRPKS
jgi:predicted DNA-binding transcriptional regulator AlpA